MAKIEYCERCGYIKPQCECDKPKTNADRIRSMTDEELAEIMDSDCYKLMCFKRGCPHKPGNGVTCKECYLRWLKSEVGCE